MVFNACYVKKQKQKGGFIIDHTENREWTDEKGRLSLHEKRDKHSKELWNGCPLFINEEFE